MQNFFINDFYLAIIIDSPKVEGSLPVVRRGRPPNKPKAEAAQIKAYTIYLKSKIKKLGRIPSHEENKKSYAEFTRQKNRAAKRKAEDSDKDWTYNLDKRPKYEKAKKSQQGLIGNKIEYYCD